MFTTINKRARRNLWHWLTEWALPGWQQPKLQGVHARHAKTQVSRRSFDRLEERMLMACDAWIDTADPENGMDDYLRVEGDASANTVEIWSEGDSIAADVDCAPQTKYFAANRMPNGILVLGFAGNDRITVFGSVTIAVVIEGGDGSDTMTGGSGNDTIRGGNQNDRLNGSAGNDSLQGDAGNDSLDGGSGADKFNGGTGTDTADYSARVQNLTIDLDDVADDGAAGEGDNVQSSVENVWGGRGNDRITGSSANNQLKGNNGKDSLYGGKGDDSLWGNDGDDQLFGEDGNDYLWGGKNNDYLRGDAGLDFLMGEWGTDTLEARDGQLDTVDGGLDNDVCWADAIDVVLSCP